MYCSEEDNERYFEEGEGKQRILVEGAMAIVRGVQQDAMSIGFYLALAGGCLNKGYSENDVDLVAVPRDGTSYRRDLVHLIDKCGWVLKRPPTYFSRGRQVDVYHYEHEGVDIDLAIVGGR